MSIAVRTISALLLWLAVALPAPAAQLAAEGFEDYPTGSIGGASGGSGWSGAWQGAGEAVEAVIDSGGGPLAYRTAGGEQILGGTRALSVFGNNDHAVERALDAVIDAPDVYVSMLVRFTGTQNDNDFLALWFEDAGFGAAPNIGIKMNDGTGARPEDLFVRTQASNHVSVVDLQPGRTYFLVGHLSKPDAASGTAYDTFRLWVDPGTLDVPPAEHAVSVGNGAISSFGRVGVRAVNLDAGDAVAIDRLRIGTRWEDVATPDRVPVLQLDFDEPEWTGAAGEVADSALGHPGSAFGGATTSAADPARPGSVGTCRYADFDGSDDHVQVPHAVPLNGAGELTYMAWVRPRTWSGVRQIMAKSVHGGGAGRAQMGMFSEDGVLKLRAETLNGRFEVSTALPPTGTWFHVAGVFDGAGLSLYVDGARAATRSFAPTALVQTGDPLEIGKRVGSNQYFFDGGLDEVRVYRVALSGAEVAAAKSATRPCAPESFATANAFRVSHDGLGIHCLDEDVDVTVLDAGGSVLTGYAGEVTLTTSTGRGSWSLRGGSGALTDPVADDGAARYTFTPADGGVARFWLSYPEGAALDVDVFQSGAPDVHDTDAEGLLEFAPSGFTVTAGALPDPPPSPIADDLPAQRAGVAFPLHITAYGVTDDDPLCGVIESYAGARVLRFSTGWTNPATGSEFAAVDGTAADGVSDQTVTFSAGRAQVSVTYADAGEIRLDLRDTTSFPHTLGGASNEFVEQPARLVVTAVRSTAGVDNPGAASASGPAFVAAGEAFEVEVEAQAADGTPTPNFGRETPHEGVRVSSASLVYPGGGRNGSSGDVSGGDAFAATVVPGRFRNVAVAFDEVGGIRLRPGVADGDYLGSGPVDAVTSGDVGRFRPAAFGLLSATVSPGCGTFTYMDQPALGIAYVLQALTTTGTVTENYDAALLGAGAVAGVTVHAENDDDGVDRGARLSGLATAWSLGEHVVDTSGAVFARQPAPDGPFDGLLVSLTATDPLDAVPLQGVDSNAATSGDCSSAGDCDAVRLDATRVLYGRLAVLPASGPENEALRIPLAAQRYGASGFERNGDDSCTGYSAAAASLTDYDGSLADGDTSVAGPLGTPNLLGGRDDAADPLQLSPPGIGHDGTLRVTLDVAPWLEFDWQGSGLEDPAATASFGRYRGHDRIIYRGDAP